MSCSTHALIDELIDAQPTQQFFQEHNVRLSVEVGDKYRSELANESDLDRPNFFYWEHAGALYLIDFSDGFSSPLSESLDFALALIAAGGTGIHGREIHWRDADKCWHMLETKSHRAA